MPTLKEEINEFFQGEVADDPATLQKFSHDASIFEVKPQLVVFPKDVDTLGKLVTYVAHKKREDPTLSLTARSAGTDMSGGAINDSIIVGFEKYFTHTGEVQDHSIETEPGVFYRDFEKKTLTHKLLMPSYPASREICMVGGMVSNNAGGEKSLQYGKVADYVQELDVILRDGRQYHLKPLTADGLKAKMTEGGLEGELYRGVHDLIEKHRDLIAKERPRVHKDSTGYHLWDVWDGQTFDLTKLFVGSQGTLGLVTKIKFRLVPVKPSSGMLVLFLPDLSRLVEVIHAILPTQPTSLETFDDHTLKFAIRYFFYFRKTLGWARFLSLALHFAPDIRFLLGGIPKLTILVEYEGDTAAAVKEKVEALKSKLVPLGLPMEEAETKSKAMKFWTVRRESFNLLRHNVKGGHTAPFIDDFVVPPDRLPEFFPKLVPILDDYKLLYTIAGHVGDGNFHIIPLMKLQNEEDRQKIEPVMRKVNDLVIQYGGSISGEHNDGLIRGSFLNQMYSEEMIELFRQIKKLFDPADIFNPHKKVEARWDYSSAHVRQSF